MICSAKMDPKISGWILCTHIIQSNSATVKGSPGYENTCHQANSLVSFQGRKDDLACSL